jgi:hypothetical protein
MTFKLITDNTRPTSLATLFRKKRFSFFLSLLSQLEYPISILDVGGTEQFWQLMGFCNIESIKINPSCYLTK